MSKAVLHVVGVLVIVLTVLCSADAAGGRDLSLLQTRLTWVPAMVIASKTGSACRSPNITDDLYIAIPPREYRRGRSCNKKVHVTCAEPFGDLGGPWSICKTRKVFTLTVVDQVLDEPLDDDLVYISHKAFSLMANPDVKIIRLLVLN